ncbi:recombination-associated protein RdgC [Alishewanella sp. SMS8]|uniref:recombination-associated protein RdgC n=1 Tax=unclassified Alishewanella TaxID=2628974 RepID=UPI0027423BEE|nr:recombination-associated protein RdgC [Alishewanella sp. SMS8]MDP4946036.1 recombination-associated protein RdgC [Alishewanella sp.]MDP5035120.1 recombination-associated protein RdgC [Alishewanella sp.]MDP5188042.1 recombination-associated protein RdgC [Alishewanella sp.]MDP5458620.1 recombination-associated protein RdgC [Alishewanella sp. SMS8]
MWFKNIRVYKLSAPLTTDLASLEQAFAEFKFSPCTGQEAVKSGFSYPLHNSIKQYCHQQQHRWFFAIKRQEKILPAAVINEELQPKIDAAEQEQGRALSRKEKQALKEELIHTLLPRAFSRSQLTQGYYDAQQNWLVINSSSASKAEDILALLRKAIGSLPALPWLDSHKLNSQLQQWLKHEDLPKGFMPGAEVELKAPDEEGAKVRFSNHLLSADEVQTHLQDKLVTRISLQQTEGVSLTITDDGSIKQVKYPDSVIDHNDELGWDDLPARLDADLLLMADSVNNALLAISEQVNSHPES